MLDYVEMSSTTTTTSGLILGTKGLKAQPTLASGDFLVSGYLTRWIELDREGERMVRGAFRKSITAFLRGSAPLCYAHRLVDVIGSVLDLVEDEIGVKMTARVNHQAATSPLRWIYEAIKAGSIKGLSVGAIFKRQRRDDGSADIIGADIIECSATATPMLPSAGFEIVSEGKALAMFGAHDRADAITRLELATIAARAREARERSEAVAALRELAGS